MLGVRIQVYKLDTSDDGGGMGQSKTWNWTQLPLMSVSEVHLEKQVSQLWALGFPSGEPFHRKFH